MSKKLAIDVDYIENMVNNENWGLKDCIGYYNTSEAKFLSAFKAEYQFTPARATELIELMKQNDEKKAVIAQEVEEVLPTVSEEIANLIAEKEECSSNLKKLEEESKLLEERGLELHEIIQSSSRKVKDFLKMLEDEEKIVLACNSEIKGIKAKTSEVAKKIEVTEAKIVEIDKAIEAKSAIKIFCGNCPNPEDYTEVWSNGTLPAESIREIANKCSEYEEISKFDDLLSMKQFREAVEFYLLAYDFSKKNKNVKYFFEKTEYEEIYDILSLIDQKETSISVG